MKRKKFIICMILSCLIFMMGSKVTEFKSYAETNEKISDIMALTGITRDIQGNYVAKKNYVARDEFAQMLVQASPYAGEVKTTNKLKLFKDVSKKDSKAAYIQIAVLKGYMSGYLGGMFKPDKAVTLKEAIYSTLCLLGYTKDDYKGNLSDARYEKFKELGLSKNISCKEMDKLTKKDCEHLFYNLLNAKQKAGEIYGKSLGYTLTEAGKIDYNALLLKKTKGPFLTKNNWENRLEGKLSSYNIFINGVKSSSKNIEDYNIVYYAEKVKKVWVYNEKVYGTLDSITLNQGEPQELSVSGVTYTVENSKKMKKIIKNASIQKNMSVVLLLGKDDKVSYVLPIYTTIANGNWKQSLSFNLKNATIYKNETLSTSASIENTDVIYYSKELKYIWAYDKKSYGTLDSFVLNQSEPQELTLSGTTYTVENPKEMKKIFKNASIQKGMAVVLLLGRDDKVSNVLPLTCLTAVGNWQQNLSFDINTGTIYKNGAKVTVSDIESYDVIYYSNELKSMWVYGKKAYGVLESISPNTSAPEEIVVAGNTYDLKTVPVAGSYENEKNLDNLEENAWGKRIRENGLEVGSNVVVLFGYNGKIADIYPIEKMQVVMSGYVLSVENKATKNENQTITISQVIRMVDTEGIIREFPCTDNTITKGTVVEVSFQNGKAIIKKINIKDSTYNLSDIKNKKIATDARIIQVKDLSYTKTSDTELKETNWNADNVIYYKLNSSGEITDLILNNTTGSFYQYGILKKVTFPVDLEASNIITLACDIGGSETNFEIEQSTWNLTPGPKAFRIEDNKLKEMVDLKSVRIAYISGKQANTGDAVYRIADDVQVYYSKNNNYYKGKFEDISNLDNHQVCGYIEQIQGPIRVIVITN